MMSLKLPALKEIEKLAQTKTNCISFSQGALRMGGVHQDIKEYIRQISQSEKADYYQDSLGIIQLRKKIAESFAEKHDINISTDHIAITHGSMGAITSLCLAILNPGDEVILPEPTYPCYQQAVSIAKATPVSISAWNMVAREKNYYRWLFDIDAIEKSITPQTKMIILSNPSNPLGCVLSKQEVLHLARLCENKGIYLVVDEIYDDFIFEGSFYSVTPLSVGSDRIIRVGSFSKCFGMSGWRVGYIVGSKRLIGSIGSIQTATLNCPNVIAQYGAWFGLEHKEEIVDPYYEKLTIARKVVCDFFDFLQAQGEYTYAKPDAGFYIFFKTKEQSSYPFVIDLLEKANIALVPGIDFGNSYHSFVRLCFAREPEIIHEGIRRFQDYLAQKSLTQSVMSL